MVLDIYVQAPKSLPRWLQVGLTWKLALHVFRNPSLNSFTVSPEVISARVQQHSYMIKFPTPGSLDVFLLACTFYVQIAAGVCAKPNSMVPQWGWELNWSCGNVPSSLGGRSDPLSPHACPSYNCSSFPFSPQSFLLSHVCRFTCLTTLLNAQNTLVLHIFVHWDKTHIFLMPEVV